MKNLADTFGKSENDKAEEFKELKITEKNENNEERVKIEYLEETAKAENPEENKNTVKKEKCRLLKALPLGALFFALSSIIVKGVGALYKIPLAALLGAEGVGLYQMIFPLYALLLIFSASSVPTALTRIIGGGYEKKSVVKKSFVLFLTIGAFSGAALFAFAGQISAAQGNENAATLYRVISPAVLICSAIAVLRGILQGEGSFFYTSVSQIIEQCVKAAFGLTVLLVFSNVFGNDVIKKTATAVFAVVFSETVTLAYLIFAYKKRARAANRVIIQKQATAKPFGYKTLLFYVAPLCLTGLIMPLSAFSDSFIAVNALKQNFTNATSMFGAFAGGSETVIALPVGAITAFATACLPELTENPSSGKKMFAFCAAASAFSAVAIFLFSQNITDLLFSRFGEYKAIVSALLKVSAVNVVFQSLLAVSNVCLLALNKQAYSVFSMFTGLAIKVSLSVILVKNPQINLFGLVISDSCFYFVALGLNLGYIISCSRKNAAACGFKSAKQNVLFCKKRGENL